MRLRTATDDHTVKIVLKDDFAPALVSWQKTSIIPKHVLEKEADINLAPFNSAPIGTGPFVFKTRVAGDRIEFEANPKYHGGELRTLEIICAMPITVLTVKFSGQFTLRETW